MTAKACSYLRQVDTVILKGSAQTINLYTIDVDVDSITTDLNPYMMIGSDKEDKKRRKVRARMRRNRLRESINNETFTPADMFTTDVDLCTLRATFNDKRTFFKVFEKGFQNYITGNWHQAKTQFLQIPVIIFSLFF